MLRPAVAVEQAQVPRCFPFEARSGAAMPRRPREVGALSEASRCGALARTTGRPCRNAAGFKTPTPGLGRCHLHGGATVNHRIAAARAQARLDAGTFGVETPIDAGQAIELVLGMRRGQVEALARRLRAADAELSPAERIALSRALDDALTQLASTGKMAADVGVDERRR
ncbi:MAG: hypothetical protein JWQ48_535, partial [Conexibacter sp.]|nr:hypothetical protein [Conexibacter sp.]